MVVGKTTLRRYEDQGVVPKTGRVDAFHNRSVRVFTSDDVKRLRQALC